MRTLQLQLLLLWMLLLLMLLATYATCNCGLGAVEGRCGGGRETFAGAGAAFEGVVLRECARPLALKWMMRIMMMRLLVRGRMAREKWLALASNGRIPAVEMMQIVQRRLLGAATCGEGMAPPNNGNSTATAECATGTGSSVATAVAATASASNAAAASERIVLLLLEQMA